MNSIPRRENNRPQIRSASGKSAADIQKEIAEQHALWVSSNGAQGHPDDDKIADVYGARDSKGNLKKNLRLRTDVED